MIASPALLTPKQNELHLTTLIKQTLSKNHENRAIFRTIRLFNTESYNSLGKHNLVHTFSKISTCCWHWHSLKIYTYCNVAALFFRYLALCQIVKANVGALLLFVLLFTLCFHSNSYSIHLFIFPYKGSVEYAFYFFFGKSCGKLRLVKRDLSDFSWMSESILRKFDYEILQLNKGFPFQGL